mmetsp:Transcript_19519/g.26377  ORF Transcript_19519/g.26377 Transcript_19519/m.26377 type:complete len:143 (-) Transcript_19519:69-497(-)|eukprot:CAMPEP_0185567238 /NCGR_PEP_ID=MMETSP0434-20130131/578_1 /TAXON_ID=626734 ORGANISM="Favella taraikaensis, Strain Fe Narragansett Bay" /NCGR_SAMPLE_ID=MMETSP0434 /ASSEMBLY_ACC=CAM_ASM_000379 /LENGTH=142 /DNA_ID=CAMNT_0028181427 /DNA_START=13 /DNA_END=441 /DNA_ORIENTATION=+
MPKKRRNGGRSGKKGRGKTRQVDCAHCNCKPAKDKAIKRFIVRNIVDSGAMNDLKASCAYDLYALPKWYMKTYYCISCAVHMRVVRVRNRQMRRNRQPPQRFRRRDDGGKKPEAPKPAPTAPVGAAPTAAAPAAAPEAAAAV